jgi:hypothetical protein
VGFETVCSMSSSASCFLPEQIRYAFIQDSPDF